MSSDNKSQNLVIAIAAAGAVIVIVLGVAVALLAGPQEDPATFDPFAAPSVPVDQQIPAPALTEEQIAESEGALPSGHVPVGQTAPEAAPPISEDSAAPADATHGGLPAETTAEASE